MALTQNRMTPYRHKDKRNLSLAAGAVVYAGGMVAMDATGFVNAASTATGLVAVGVATHYEDNTGGDDGDQHVELQRGFFAFSNSAGADEITRADIGQVCYMVDDQTVAKTDGTATRSPAGIVDGVDNDGVWVNIDPTNGVAASA